MHVNGKKRGRPKQGANKLDYETIVTTAKAWLLQEQRGITIRGLASRLEVDPMAIYHYFANKAALLEAITISIMEDIYQPDEGGNWKVELEKLCMSYLTLLRDHPSLLETFLSMGSEGQGPARVFAARFDIALEPLDLNDDLKGTTLELLVDYMHGFALAIHCAKGDAGPDISAMKKPLALVIHGLNAVR